MNLQKYYEHYLSLHQNKWNRRLHVIGQFATLVFIGLCVQEQEWFLLFLAPLIVYPFAWLGHLFFEKNRPLAWKGKQDYGATTLKAKMCDIIMFRDWILGRIER